MKTRKQLIEYVEHLEQSIAQLNAKAKELDTKNKDLLYLVGVCIGLTESLSREVYEIRLFARTLKDEE